MGLEERSHFFAWEFGMPEQSRGELFTLHIPILMPADVGSSLDELRSRLAIRLSMGLHASVDYLGGLDEGLYANLSALDSLGRWGFQLHPSD